MRPVLLCLFGPDDDDDDDDDDGGGGGGGFQGGPEKIVHFIEIFSLRTFFAQEC